MPGQTPPIHTIPPGGWTPVQTPDGQLPGAQGAQGSSEPTAAFLAKLKAAGLRIGKGGRIIGSGMGTPEQLRLAQRGYNRFGLRNTYFDPSRAGVRGGNIYDLGTGSGLRTPNGSGDVLRDAALANMRERSGYDPAVALQRSGQAGTGIAFQSPEMYQRYLDAARANYQLGAGGQVTNPNAQAMLDAGTIRTDVPNAAPSYTFGLGGRPAAQTQPPPRTDQFPNPNIPTQQPNRPSSPPIVPQPSGGWSYPAQNAGGQPSTTPPAAAGLDALMAQRPQMQTQGLPLDATFEAQRRMADDQLARTLAQIGPAREQIGAQQALALARLATQQGLDTSQIRENLAGRGVLDSSLYGDQLGLLATDYLRRNQDLASDVADAYGALQEALSGAYGDYSQSMAEYLLELANRTANDSNSAVDVTGGRRRRRRRRGKRGRNR